MLFVPRTPGTSPPSMRRVAAIVGGCGLVAFVALLPVMRWAGEFEWSRATGYAALAGVGVATALVVLHLGAIVVDRLADRALDALGRLYRRVVPRYSAGERARRLASLAALLDAVEAELRRIGWWSADPPPLREQFARGELRSFLDAPSFELWLQCVFLPNARAAVAADALPPSSSVGVMAMRQYDYHSHVPEAQDLLALLSRFDAEANALVGHDPLAP